MTTVNPNQDSGGDRRRRSSKDADDDRHKMDHHDHKTDDHDHKRDNEKHRTKTRVVDGILVNVDIDEGSNVSSEDELKPKKDRDADGKVSDKKAAGKSSDVSTDEERAKKREDDYHGQDRKVSDKNVVGKSSHASSDEESAKVKAKKKDDGSKMVDVGKVSDKKAAGKSSDVSTDEERAKKKEGGYGQNQKASDKKVVVKSSHVSSDEESTKVKSKKKDDGSKMADVGKVADKKAAGKSSDVSTDEERAKKREDDYHGQDQKVSDKKVVGKSSDEESAEVKARKKDDGSKMADDGKVADEKTDGKISKTDNDDGGSKKEKEDEKKDENEMDSDEEKLLHKILEKKSSDENSDEDKKNSKDHSKKKHKEKKSKKKESEKNSTSSSSSSDDEKHSKKKDAKQGRKEKEIHAKQERKEKEKDAKQERKEKGSTSSESSTENDEEQMSINNKFSGDGRAWEILAKGAKEFASEEKVQHGTPTESKEDKGKSRKKDSDSANERTKEDKSSADEKGVAVEKKVDKMKKPKKTESSKDSDEEQRTGIKSKKVSAKTEKLSDEETTDSSDDDKRVKSKKSADDGKRVTIKKETEKIADESSDDEGPAKSKKNADGHEKRPKLEEKEQTVKINVERTPKESSDDERSVDSKKAREKRSKESSDDERKENTESRRKREGAGKAFDGDRMNAKMSGDGRAWELLAGNQGPHVDKAVERARRMEAESSGSDAISRGSDDGRVTDSKKKTEADHENVKVDSTKDNKSERTVGETKPVGAGSRDKVVIVKNKSFSVHTEDESSPIKNEKAIVKKVANLQNSSGSNASIEEERIDTKKKKYGDKLTVPGHHYESSDEDNRTAVGSKKGADGKNGESKNGSNVYSGDENNGTHVEHGRQDSGDERSKKSAKVESTRKSSDSSKTGERTTTKSKTNADGKISDVKSVKSSNEGGESEKVSTTAKKTEENAESKKSPKSGGADGKSVNYEAKEDKKDAAKKGPTDKKDGPTDKKDGSTDKKDGPKNGPTDKKGSADRDVEANKKPTTFTPPVVAGAEAEEPKPMTLKDKILAKLKCGGKKKDTHTKRMTDMKREVDMDEHKIPLEELFQRFKTDPDSGLSDSTITEFREKYGKNELSPPETTPEWLKFVKATFTGFGILLFIGGVLCMICFGIDKSTNEFALNDNAWLSLTLFLVVFISGSLSYYQDRSSAKIMASFQNMVPDKCVVWRNGGRKELPANELLPGDIVELKGGDKIPADIRILESNLFKVDNSSLTGESEPQARNAEFTNENPLETSNIVFYSTFALEGGAKGVVVKTGDSTVMGRIATLTIGLDVGATPIAIEINHFIKIISIVAITYGIIVFIICMCYHYPFISAVLIFIGCVMGNVPEGLLIEVTVLFALTAKRMASKNCLVRKLQAVETLGSTSVICSDKTGTLTQNRMTVAHVWFNNTIRDADMSQDHFTFRNKEGMNADHTDADFIALAQCAALCNRAEFKEGQKEMPVLRRECIGDASENALLKYVQIAIGNVVDWRKRNPKLVEIPFNSTNKYQVSVHVLENKSKGNYLVVMKGAPERILERCSTYLDNGKLKPVDDDFRDQFNGAYYTMGSMGERVLGFCDCILPNDEYPAGFEFNTDPRNFPVEGFRFLGLMSMIDPPRPGVPDAVQKCRSAGIRVTMVTGDHPITAKAIAKSVGIFTEGVETIEDIAERENCAIEDVDPSLAEACVIHGSQLKDMSVEDLAHVLKTYKEIVFARTSPQQKLMIVEGYQKLGYFVAVTGDGVNDSPALKQADIGIAMGISGSDVSKQAADMILMDDNFASIVTGVEEGRLIFDNLKKAMTYVLITNIPEIMPFILIIPLGIPLALNTVTILCICLGTDIWPAISLAYEHAESDIMKRKPRDNKTEKLVNARLISYVYGQMGIMETVGSYFAYFVVFGECGFWPRHLFGLLDDWDNFYVNDLEDSYGQQWTYSNRKALEYHVNSVYFCANVVIQWANLIVCKTRRNSILHQGMGNWWLNSGLVFETVLCAFLCYTPGLDTGLRLYGPKFWWWWPALPFAVYVFCFDELRKYLIRRSTPGTFVDTEFKF